MVSAATRRTPRKRFGQHFLTRDSVARRIVDLAELTAGDSVLEIGPGRRALSDRLAERARKLLLVEIDRDLGADLIDHFEGTEVETVIADVLRIDLAALLRPHAPVTIVANLPYNISTPLLARLLELRSLLRRLVVMVQLEVAERICAPVGTKQYGAFSVYTQLTTEARIAIRVPPAAFRPRPAVDSAVVVLDPKPPIDGSERDIESARALARRLFTQRRKQLGNLLRPFTPAPRSLLATLGIDSARRPETLSPVDFVRLARALEEHPVAPPPS